jgi:hypothetical protein
LCRFACAKSEAATLFTVADVLLLRSKRLALLASRFDVAITITPFPRS